MIDEVQDCSEVILDIVMNQKKQTVLCGDEYQKIYEFRCGDINIFETIYDYTEPNVMYLRNSYRVGFLIGHFTNMLLKKAHHSKKKFYGIGCKSNIYTFNNDYNSFENKLLILTKTNLNIYTIIDDILQQTVGKKIYIVGDRINIKDDLHIFTNLDLFHEKKNNIFEKFKNHDEISHYIEMSNNNSGSIYHNINKTHLRLYDMFKNNTLEKINNLKKHVTYNIDEADFVISTIHQYKGKEYTDVLLGQDLTYSNDREQNNLLYVAITRTKENLYVNQNIYNLYKKLHGIDIENQIEIKIPNQMSTKECCINCNIKTHYGYNKLFFNNVSDAINDCNQQEKIEYMCRNCQIKRNLIN